MPSIKQPNSNSLAFVPLTKKQMWRTPIKERVREILLRLTKSEEFPDHAKTLKEFAIRSHETTALGRGVVLLESKEEAIFISELYTYYRYRRLSEDQRHQRQRIGWYPDFNQRHVLCWYQYIGKGKEGVPEIPFDVNDVIQFIDLFLNEVLHNSTLLLPDKGKHQNGYISAWEHVHGTALIGVWSIHVDDGDTRIGDLKYIRIALRAFVRAYFPQTSLYVGSENSRVVVRAHTGSEDAVHKLFSSSSIVTKK